MFYCGCFFETIKDKINALAPAPLYEYSLDPNIPAEPDPED